MDRFRVSRYSGAIPKGADSRLASTLTSSVSCNGARFPVCRCFVLVTFILHFLKCDRSLARVELKRGNSRAPVKGAGRFVILLRVPECASVLGIDGHAAVITPAFEAVYLHTSPIHQKKRRFHGV